MFVPHVSIARVTVKRIFTVKNLFTLRTSMMSGQTTTYKIGTHNGVFHADDVLACYFLTRLPEFSKASIIRTRDQAILDRCDLLVDVGGVYSHEKKRYDHHQREFSHTLNSLEGKCFNIKLSSAGLIYHHYGRQVIKTILDLKDDNDQVECFFDKVYQDFVQEIDAIDNGVEISDGELKYRINTDLSSRISHLTPKWNEESSDDILYQRFFDAMKVAGKEFEESVVYVAKVWYPAKLLVKEAFNTREKVHKSGAIIEIPKGGVPWKDHLFSLEKELHLENEIKFAIFLDNKANNWRVIACPLEPKSFLLRCPLSEEWRGLRNDVLSQKSGIPGCIFVHSSGFIGGNLSREGAIEMAVKSLSCHN